MAQKPTLQFGHWKSYTLSDEAPPLMSDTVDELEFRLRRQFPEVFEAAKRRELSRQQFQARRSSIY